ncbi:MAG: hypothetical protein SCJ93_12135 [Bacillota bacterium]|nr:hypothetical protein [Bacillota bacterium]
MKTRKMLAPITITILLLMYIGFFVWAWSVTPVPLWGKIIGLVIPLSLMGISIFVLLERIKEIRSGEEDDLSKY